jgi:hypothetical protein
MEAAAAGKSTIGIPQKVGKAYRAIDRIKAQRARAKDRKLNKRHLPPV